MDKGSDGESAMNALVYKFGLNLWQWPDPSHGVNRDIDLALKHCNLYHFWLLMLVSWNLPFGPDKDDLRYHQLRDAMKSYFKKNTARTAVLFQELCPHIIDEHMKAGVSYPGSQDVDLECWDYIASRQFFAKVGRRTNLNRFCGSIESAEFNLPNWTTDLLERTVVSLECDFLRGNAFLNKFSLRPGEAEQVSEGGGSTSTSRLQIED
jgi:hypothetical protein